MRTEGLLPNAGRATKGGSLSYSGSNGNVPHVASELSATSAAQGAWLESRVSILRAFCFYCRSGYR